MSAAPVSDIAVAVAWAVGSDTVVGSTTAGTVRQVPFPPSLVPDKTATAVVTDCTVHQAVYFAPPTVVLLHARPDR